MKDGTVERFPEPNHMRSQEGSAFVAMRRDLFERHIMIFENGVFVYAPVFPDVSMELYDIFRACPLMESVDVLCDQRKMGKKFFPLSKHLVASIGFFGSDDSSSPVIPFPDQFGILDECRECGELFGSVCFTQAFFSPELRDT